MKILILFRTREYIISLLKSDPGARKYSFFFQADGKKYSVAERDKLGFILIIEK